MPKTRPPYPPQLRARLIELARSGRSPRRNWAKLKWGKTPGAVGALLRREGLYSSHLATWRAARDRGELAVAPKKRGPTPEVRDPRDNRIAELERETARWRKRAERAEALVEIQKKLRLKTPRKVSTVIA